MPGHGRTIGIILIAIAVVVLLASVVWLLAEPATGAGGKALGLLLVLLVFVLPLGGGGAYLVPKAGRRAPSTPRSPSRRRSSTWCWPRAR